jgi:signal transduction histidine kinase
LQIYIEDEGKGFDADKVSGNSSGIIGMRERALALDGSLAISSTPGEGTSIEVILPLTQD